MDDILSFPYILESVEEVESDSGLDVGLLFDKAFLTGMRRKISLTSLEIGKEKVMIIQSRWQIL